MNPRPSSSTAPEVDRIRNIALVGPSHSGKTTLVEHLAFGTGAINRVGTVEAGTTLSDVHPSDREQGRSTALGVVTLDHAGYRLNLLDTPGYPDFVGDVRAGLRAADAALFVVSAVDEVDATTVMLWDECADVGMPRAIVITKADRDSADIDATIEACQAMLGPDDPILPVHLPLLDDNEKAIGLVGLIDERILDYTTGSPVERDPDPQHLDLVSDYRSTLLEAIITESEDETLLDRFLSGESIEDATVVTDLEKAVARGHFHPILITATTPAGFGIHSLLGILTRGFPSPLEHALPLVTSPDGEPRPPLTCDPQGPLCAEVVQTSSDTYVGRKSVVRVFSGTLLPDRAVHVSGHFLTDRGHDDHDVDERAGAIFAALPGDQEAIPEARAGDIVTVTRLTRAETADTLSDPEFPLLIEPWVLPDPLYPVALRSPAASDDAKFTAALARCVAEDPTLRLERVPQTGQTILWCMGEGHRDATVTRLTERSGLAVEFEPVVTPLRSTFASAATGTGRLVKQSGGHGQFAVCTIEVSPAPPGSGLTFIDRVVGGAIPRNYIPAVERGLAQAMQDGIIDGQPLVDLEVTLVDGKAHSVDSSDMAFATAGALALTDAAEQAGLVTLEPVDAVEVEVPEDYLGAVMTDLAARRGRVTGTTPGEHGRVVVLAEVPAMELVRFPLDLRSLAHGTGVFRRSELGFQPGGAAEPSS